MEEALARLWPGATFLHVQERLRERGISVSLPIAEKGLTEAHRQAGLR